MSDLTGLYNDFSFKFPDFSTDTYMRRVSQEFKPSKKTFSELPTFEWDGLSDRFKSQEKSYHLPCNLYNLNDKKNVADISKKIVSSR